MDIFNPFSASCCIVLQFLESELLSELSTLAVILMTMEYALPLSVYILFLIKHYYFTESNTVKPLIDILYFIMFNGHQIIEISLYHEIYELEKKSCKMEELPYFPH
jgi:hypothetical protein